MKTTELFVDIFIIGFLSLLWISGFIFSFVFEPTFIIKFLFESSGNALFVILVISYSLGIIFDYINSGIFSFFKSKEENELYADMSLVKVIAQNDKLYPLIENYYGRVRILRSIIISIPLLAGSSCCILYFYGASLKNSLSFTICFIIIFGLILWIVAMYSYSRRNKDYKKYVMDMKELYLPKTPTNSNPE